MKISELYLKLFTNIYINMHFVEIQNTNLKDYMQHYANCSIIYNNQDTYAAQVPFDG